MTLSKICGLSTDETVAAAVAGRTAFVGFNFFAPSPRYVVPERAARLAAPVRGKARVVAITVDADNDALAHIDRTLAPDLIQLHGKETPARVADIRQRLATGLIKVIPVSDAADIAGARAFEDLADHLMFDARPPSGSALPGGVGARFDWTLLAGERFSRPWFLAGGLDPWNVAEAVRLSGAPIVDVSSGVERGAGLKDAALIHSFLEAVRRI